MVIPVGSGPHRINEKRDDPFGGERKGFVKEFRAVGGGRLAQPVGPENRRKRAVSGRYNKKRLYGTGLRAGIKRNIMNGYFTLLLNASLDDMKVRAGIILKERQI